MDESPYTLINMDEVGEYAYQLSPVLCKLIEQAAAVHMYTCTCTETSSQACTNISSPLLQCYQLEARLGRVILEYMRWAVIDSLPQTQALLKSAGKTQRGAERQRCSLVHILRWNSAVSSAGTHTVDTHSNTQDCLWHRLCFYLIWL